MMVGVDGTPAIRQVATGTEVYARRITGTTYDAHLRQRHRGAALAAGRRRVARHSLSACLDPLAAATGAPSRAAGRDLYPEPCLALRARLEIGGHHPRHRAPSRAARLLAHRPLVPRSDDAIRGAARQSADRR